MEPFKTPDSSTWLPPPPWPFDEIASGRTTLAEEVAAGRVKVECWGSGGQVDPDPMPIIIFRKV